jgi:tRNA(Arg) A34 adenosine deaminase TadA
MTDNSFPTLTVTLPSWVVEMCPPGSTYPTDTHRMALVISLARANVARSTGGPFGAAIFDRGTGQVIAPGVNLVVSARAAVAHAEMVAIALAGQALASFDLGVGTELVTSVEPCAMCLGALPWSGVGRMVSGAREEDARSVGFDEGDKPEDWVQSLQRRGIEVVRDVGREDAVAVLLAYVRAGGVIYNGRIR